MMHTSTTQPASRFPAACTAWRLIGLATLVLGPAACTEMADPVAGEQALTDTLVRAKQKGVTTVVITQRPALLSIVDKVLILRGGRVEAFGPPKDVLRRVMNPKPAAPSPGPEAPPAKIAEAAQ